MLTFLFAIATDIAAKYRARFKSDNGNLPVSAWQEEFLRLVREQIGLGEEGGNNRGPHIKKWGRGKDKINWCAAMLAWCMEEAAANLGYHVPLFAHPKWRKWRLSAKALWREIGKLGGHVDLPLPGDLSLFERGKDGDWKGHIEAVDSVTLGEAFDFVDIGGNVGKFPARVKRINRHPKRNRFIGWVRLPDLATVGIKVDK